MTYQLVFFLKFNKIKLLEPHTFTFLLLLFYLYRLGKPVKWSLKPVTHIDAIEAINHTEAISYIKDIA